MIITPNLLAAVAPHASTDKSSSGTNGVSDLFLQLLTTQLKAQSPADPVDPTAFVSQLIQFNSLDQLTQIRQLLATKTASTAPITPLPTKYSNPILR
jgi:flagellar basal-body rod modification protein FlgD